MGEEPFMTIGYYSIFKIKTSSGFKFVVDSGKILYVARYKKFIPNPYRDVKEFPIIDKAKQYIKTKLKKKNIEKKKKLASLPKSLYLVLIRELNTDLIFVKVGFTTKRFIMRRFSKSYGYEGYSLETILRRVDSPDAEMLEAKIKEKLNKTVTIKKYRPILKSFSGYSECYNLKCIDEIIKIFDETTKDC